MAHRCLGDSRKGLAPFWGGEDGRRRRPGSLVLVCQVLDYYTAHAAETEWSECTVA